MWFADSRAQFSMEVMPCRDPNRPRCSIGIRHFQYSANPWQQSISTESLGFEAACEEPKSGWADSGEKARSGSRRYGKYGRTDYC